VAGALLQSGLFEERLDGLWRSSRDVLRRAVPLAERPAFAVVVALGGVLLLVLAARVLSVAWALYTLWGFRLTRRGDDLRAEHGLLTRVSKTIPRHRIQVLTTREGLLHQLLGRAAVQVQTAGGAEGEEASPGRLWLAPLIRAERVDDIVREAFPDVDMAAAPWQSVSPRARTRLLRATIGLLLPLIATGAYLLGGWVVPLAALALAVAATQIGLVVRRTAWALAPGTVLFRSGFWVRRTSLARFSKIQSVVLSESPFDRRHRMASVQIDTAGAGGLGHSIAVSLLDAPVARGLEERLFREAAQADFRW
jgi:putative membrane protein